MPSVSLPYGLHDTWVYPSILNNFWWSWRGREKENKKIRIPKLIKLDRIPKCIKSGQSPTLGACRFVILIDDVWNKIELTYSDTLLQTWQLLSDYYQSSWEETVFCLSKKTFFFNLMSFTMRLRRYICNYGSGLQICRVEMRPVKYTLHAASVSTNTRYAKYDFQNEN